MHESYKFSLDPSIEQLKVLPGGQGIYDYVKNKAEQLAAAIDASVLDIIAKYELPAEPKAMYDSGYQIVIEMRTLPGQPEERRAVLYKKVDEVRIIV